MSDIQREAREWLDGKDGELSPAARYGPTWPIRVGLVRELLAENERLSVDSESYGASEAVTMMSARIDRLREQIGIEVRARDEWEDNAEKAEAALDRARELADVMENENGMCWNSITAQRIRRAIDGEGQP